eukprot:CAMPEP_0115013898 /NCGR_PEP_ID=MMETSP0216-20121206/25714_1 /TAXON_ID=223996 /ORGANISM="Protocruzia adherens, Strain Boccale" /LENGTH=89 /DNA_ID=CAMNT_0002383449 /DNA_START=25 /DNA_END=294 /DNA_ORIENTATION=+
MDTSSIEDRLGKDDYELLMEKLRYQSLLNIKVKCFETCIKNMRSKQVSPQERDCLTACFSKMHHIKIETRNRTIAVTPKPANTDQVQTT